MLVMLLLLRVMVMMLLQRRRRVCRSLLILLLLLSMQNFGGHLRDQRQRLSSLVSHETDRGSVDDTRQRPQEVVFMRLVTDEVIGQIAIDLLVLLNHVRKVDEKPVRVVSRGCGC